MVRNTPSGLGNRLLARLPHKDRERFLKGCVPVELAFRGKLSEPGGTIDHIHFPTTGFVSLLTALPDGRRLEVALVGDEGMVGIPLLLGLATSQVHSQVQGVGSALRMSAAKFRRELATSAALRETLNQYLYIRIGQLTRTAACNRFHLVEERLARWLLMTSDRAHSANFRITHEFLAVMLGVRRVGVTKAASALQRRKLIRYSRGNIAIRDRPGLERAACVCYQADLDNYEDVLPAAGLA
jgi:CRP-like cAMP-binding protein